MDSWCEPDGADALVHVKAVPGARKDEVAGVLGERLKIRVAAPPEDGRANEAICRTLAAALGVPPRSVTIERGLTSPLKSLRVRGVSVEDARARLA